jgi:hypothetical protein
VQNPSLDIEWLLKVRTVVARTGEMDLARWWNSNGQLGPKGASVLRRGFPRTVNAGEIMHRLAGENMHQ